MLKRLGNYAFIGALSIAIILLAIALIPGCWNGFALLLQQIFGTNGNRISVVAALLIPFAAFVLLTFISLVLCFIVKPKKEAEAEKKKSAIFYPFFFFSFAISSLFLLPLCALLVFNPFTSSFHSDYNLLIPAIYGGCLALSLLQASLLLSAVTMWSTNKVAGMLLFVFVGVSVLACVLPGKFAYQTTNTNSYAYYDSDAAEAAPAEGDYGYEEDYAEEEQNPLANLWEDSEYETDSVRVAIEFFSERMKLTSDDHWGLLELWTYGHNQSYTYTEEQLHYGDEEKEIWPVESDFRQAFRNQIKIARYLAGDSDNLLATFNTYNSLLFDAISNETYHKSGASKLVTALYQAHDGLYGRSDTESRLSKIYKLMDNVKHGVAREYYNDIKPHVGKQTLQWLTDDSGNINEALVVWACSFWARRHHEGTDDAAYSIIYDLMGHYDDFG